MSSDTLSALLGVSDLAPQAVVGENPDFCGRPSGSTLGRLRRAQWPWIGLDVTLMQFSLVLACALRVKLP